LKNLSILFCAAVLVFGVVGISQAKLHNRGGGLIYCDTLDITLLQDANANGAWIGMTWHDAMAWAEDLQYYDSVRDVTWSDWRLPDPRNQDGSGPFLGYNFTDTEMGHIYYTELRKKPLSGGSYSGPFISLQTNGIYWMNMERVENPGYAYRFYFSSGRMSYGNKANAWTAWAVRDGDVGLIPSAICRPNKLRAASKLCTSYASCYGIEMNNSDFDLSACVSMAEMWFEWSWYRAEDNAARGERDCSTVSDSAIEDIILLGLEDIYGQIGAGLDLENRTANFLGGYLLRAVGTLSSRLLAAEGENIRIENSDRLQSARDNAYSLFERQWTNVTFWLARRPDLTYTGPEMLAVIADIDALVSDVLNGMDL